MSVPLLDVNAQNLPLEAELTAVFTKVLREGKFIMGPEIGELEQQIAKMVGAKHGIGVSSGTDALILALMSLGIGPGDEVLCPTFTFFATAGAISRLGATPVFVDSCPVCFNVDVNSAKKKLTKKTKAIIPVHLFGQSADMDAVIAFAKENGLKVIEDGAQSIGANYKGRGTGTIGDFGTYSFFPSKNLGGFGDGGMVVCNDDALAERARILRTHGSKPKYYHHFVGGNFRIDTIQAALILVKLKHYADYTKKRQDNAARYTAGLSELPGVAAADAAHGPCSGDNGAALAAAGAKIVLPVSYPHNDHIWNQYTLRIIGDGRRDAFKDFLGSKKIGCEIYYPVTMDQQKCFADLPEASRSGCEVAHRLASEAISIPIYPELPRAHQDEVIAAIAEFVKA